MVRIEGAAPGARLSLGVIVGKETNHKTFEDLEQIEAISSEQKEKTCAYGRAAATNGC